MTTTQTANGKMKTHGKSARAPATPKPAKVVKGVKAKAPARPVLEAPVEETVVEGSVSYTALVGNADEPRFYTTSIPIEDLFQLCFVDTREEDAVLGFQRAIDVRRSEAIAVYLKEGNTIPLNIVLSAQPAAEIEYVAKNKGVSFQRVKNRTFLVLDGQHRLYGYWLAYLHYGKKLRVQVAIYEGLTRQQEARIFLDINTKQQGISPALIADIRALAALEGERDGVLRQIFDQLAADPKSALHGMLSAHKAAPGLIARVAFNRAIGSTLTSSVMRDKDHETRYKLVRNYLGAWVQELGDARSVYLTRAGFLAVACGVMDDVVRTALTAHGGASQESLRRVVQPLATLNYTIAGTSSLLPKRELEMLMTAGLRAPMKLTSDML